MTNVAMTLPSLHDLVWPPYCKAKVKQTSEANIKAKPGDPAVEESLSMWP
jgi:hypothetical protein